MKKKMLLILSSACLIFLVLFSLFSFSKYDKGEKVITSDDKTQYSTLYKNENKAGIFFASGMFNSNKLNIPFLNQLKDMGADVFSFEYSQKDINKFYTEYKKAFAIFKQKTGLTDDKIIVVGYDIGGTTLLKDISENAKDFACTVLISPYYENFDEKSVVVQGGSYISKVDWIENLNVDNFNSPLAILTSTTDDFSPPQLMTMLYNKLSGDDIQKSVGAYNANKDGISLFIETGVLHSYMAASNSIFYKISNFIVDNTDIGLSEVNSHLAMGNILRFIIVINLVAVLSIIYKEIRYKFSDVSCGALKVYNKGFIIPFLIKIFSIIVGGILSIPIYLVVKSMLSPINMLQLIIPILFGTMCFVTLLGYKKYIIIDPKNIFKKIQLKGNGKNILISLIIVAITSLVAIVFGNTGYFSLPITSETFIKGLVICGFSFIGLYSYLYEKEVINLTTTKKYVNIFYDIIVAIPFIIIVIWDMFVGNYMLSFMQTNNVIMLTIFVLSAIIMKEINGNKIVTSLIIGAEYSICASIFSIFVV